MPWIHVHDLRGAIVEAVADERMSGAVNAVAPMGERNVNFTRKFAKRLRRPAVLPVPAFALKLVLGGFGGVLLASQRVRPAVLESLGFRFRHADFESALDDLLGAG
jgi:NAD dependent epimerase/dehydratase family enzyme